MKTKVVQIIKLYNCAKFQANWIIFGWVIAPKKSLFCKFLTFCVALLFWNLKEINSHFENKSCSYNQALQLCKISGHLDNFWQSYCPWKVTFFANFQLLRYYFENEKRSIVILIIKVVHIIKLYQCAKFQANLKTFGRVIAPDPWKLHFCMYRSRWAIQAPRGLLLDGYPVSAFEYLYLKNYNR